MLLVSSMLLVPFVGCGRSSSESARDALVEAHRAGSTEARIVFYRNLAEALPNVHYRGEGRAAAPVSTAVVLGEVVEAAEGYGFGTKGAGASEEYTPPAAV